LHQLQVPDLAGIYLPEWRSKFEVPMELKKLMMAKWFTPWREQYHRAVSTKRAAGALRTFSVDCSI
jgi:hypothetical protein